MSLAPDGGRHDRGSVPSLVRFGRDVCGGLAAGMRREWLVTNGLGGYAYGTLAGPPTRAYHGLLVAALEPPVGRTMLVGGLVETASVGGTTFDLSAFELSTGEIVLGGFRHIESFVLDGMLPVCRFVVGDATIERRVWMAHGRNTTYVRWTVVSAPDPVTLRVEPLVTERDHHEPITVDLRRPMTERLAGIAGADVTAAALGNGLVVRMAEGGTPILLAASVTDGGSTATFDPGATDASGSHGDRGRPWRPGEVAAGRWVRGLRHRAESERGLADVGDLYAAAAFGATLEPGGSLDLVMSAEAPERIEAPERALATALERQAGLVRRAAADRADPLVAHLVLAADQFIVERRPAADAATDAAEDAATGAAPDGRTVIAGYPWFADWGRDTMIALPGLCLATGRADEAARILRGFARYVRDGLIPNDFPDRIGVDPGYHTVDGSLWYVHAVAAYERETGDHALVDDVLPTLLGIVDRHAAGTRFGIEMDPADGLLRAGESGYQLTWMDAKAGDWVVTPRMGKPVEIQALWHEALRAMAESMEARGDAAPSERYAAMADRVRASFRARFVRPGIDHLLDVVDGPDGDEDRLRPNQLLAASLPHPLVDGEIARGVLRSVDRSLRTPYGLRSLAPDDPGYRGTYRGDRVTRDAAYHEGTVWTWLVGAYAEATWRVTGDRAAALAILEPFREHLADAGLGSISEILEGDPPHAPRGCTHQAWGVSELLRAWRLIAGE